MGLHGSALRVRVASQPIEGRANAALIDWLAGELGLSKRQIQVLAGEHSRHKKLLLLTTPDRAQAWLDGLPMPT